MSAISSVLITGSSRGIGLNLVSKLLEGDKAPKLVIATCRNPTGATALQNLAKSHSNLKILKLDVDDIDSFPAVVNQVDSLVGDAGLSVLINNAAITVKALNRNELSWKDYQSVIHTNTIAPIFLTEAFLPLLNKAAQQKPNEPLGIGKAAVLFINSLLGSVSQNSYGKYWAYRESKAALNQAARTFAVELGPKGILICNLHPGWVRTDMGGEEADISVEESVNGLMNVILNLKATDHDGYLNYAGKTIPW